jgi:hypothetical protein
MAKKAFLLAFNFYFSNTPNTLMDYRSKTKKRKTSLFLQISDPLRHWEGQAN